MTLSANYASSSYGAIAYGIRAKAIYTATTNDALTASDGNIANLLQHINIFAPGYENRVVTVGSEQRNFIA